MPTDKLDEVHPCGHLHVECIAADHSFTSQNPREEGKTIINNDFIDCDETKSSVSNGDSSSNLVVSLVYVKLFHLEADDL